VRAATASTSLHSPITCNGDSSTPLQQEHDGESSLPKCRCSNSLHVARKQPPHEIYTSHSF
jgi:hypothetical protein